MGTEPQERSGGVPIHRPFQRGGTQPFPLDVREIGSRREVGFHQGSLLRATVQGAGRGQDFRGILHETVRFPRPIQICRYELQPSRERIEKPFFREKGYGIALQTGEMHAGTGRPQPSNRAVIPRTERAARAEPNLFGFCRVAFEEE